MAAKRGGRRFTHALAIGDFNTCRFLILFAAQQRPLFSCRHKDGSCRRSPQHPGNLTGHANQSANLDWAATAQA